jgi:hypothetical protein
MCRAEEENGMAKAKAKPRAKGMPETEGAGRAGSKLVDQRIKDLGGWRGQTLARMRALILDADPEMTEETKWAKASNPYGVPVWSHDGIVCTGEAYKDVVKLTFMNGASLPDPKRLFNAGLEGGTRRAIDIREGETVDATAVKALIKAAVAGNAPKVTKRSAKPAKTVKLLAGGNPQIAKADGDAPVQAYIAALPGFKRDVGRRLDALVVRAVPGVRKAVKWNSPFYGVHGQGWFLSFHAFTRYVKVTFFKGTSLEPAPPGGNAREARWIDVHEDDLDEEQLAAWVKQAAALPGWLA